MRYRYRNASPRSSSTTPPRRRRPCRADALGSVWPGRLAAACVRLPPMLTCWAGLEAFLLTPLLVGDDRRGARHRGATLRRRRRRRRGTSAPAPRSAVRPRSTVSAEIRRSPVVTAVVIGAPIVAVPIVNTMLGPRAAAHCDAPTRLPRALAGAAARTPAAAHTPGRRRGHAPACSTPSSRASSRRATTRPARTRSPAARRHLGHHPAPVRQRGAAPARSHRPAVARPRARRGDRRGRRRHLGAARIAVLDVLAEHYGRPPPAHLQIALRPHPRPQCRRRRRGAAPRFGAGEGMASTVRAGARRGRPTTSSCPRLRAARLPERERDRHRDSGS